MRLLHQMTKYKAMDMCTPKVKPNLLSQDSSARYTHNKPISTDEQIPSIWSGQRADLLIVPAIKTDTLARLPAQSTVAQHCMPSVDKTQLYCRQSVRRDAIARILHAASFSNQRIKFADSTDWYRVDSSGQHRTKM